MPFFSLLLLFFLLPFIADFSLPLPLSPFHSYCFGDATHRHPPFNGLGSNTCIQDAFNLAWKIAYVEAGRAGPGLLASFSTERQPVGRDVITRANQGLRDHNGWMAATGMLEDDGATRARTFAELDDPGPVGRARRAAFRQGIEATTREFQGLGIEMNQRYLADGDAVYRDDEPPEAAPPLPADPVKELLIGTYPGQRLPHAWLNTRVPGAPFSTIDLAGHRRFTLLTGPAGRAAWKAAADHVSQALGVEIKAFAIGWKQDAEDVYFDWADRSQVDEDGCVLARPDRFVAWRAKAMVPDPAAKLETVMRKVLFLK